VKEKVVRERHEIKEVRKNVKVVKTVNKNITINRYNVNTRYGRSYSVDRGFWAGFATGLILGGHYTWYPRPLIYTPRWSHWYPPVVDIWAPSYWYYERHIYDRHHYHHYIDEVYPPATRPSTGLSQQQYKDIILERLTHTDEMDKTALTPEVAWDAVNDAHDFGPNKVALLLMMLNNEVLLQGEDAEDLWLWVTEQNNDFGNDISDAETDRIMNYLKEEIEAREKGYSKLFEPTEPPAPAPTPDPLPAPGPIDHVPTTPPPSVPRYGNVGEIDIPFDFNPPLSFGRVIEGSEWGFNYVEDAEDLAQSYVDAGNTPVAVVQHGDLFFVRQMGFEQFDGNFTSLRPSDVRNGVVVKNPAVMNVFAQPGVDLRARYE